MNGLASGEPPEYRQEYAQQVWRLAHLAVEEAAIARFFGVPVSVIYGPAVRCKRAASDWMRDGLHQSIRPLGGAPAPGHHGNPRALGLFSGETSTGHFFAQAANPQGDRSSIVGLPHVGDPCVMLIQRWSGRLSARYRALSGGGKKTTVVCTAVARELAGFMWAVAREVQPA